ncbi:MAG: ROK family protein [Victivallaceae bacterium]|nr:ROK family protein [Victivallaceae bacterium]
MINNNKQLILDYIWQYPGVHRRKIAEVFNFRLNLVTDVVKELLDEKWVIEEKGKKITRGRRPIALYVNKAWLASIVLTYDRKEVVGSLVNSQGVVAKVIRVKQKSGQSADVVSTLSEVICQIRKSFRGKILGVGIADPGMVDHKTGTIIKSSFFPEWEILPLSKMIADKVGLPVMIEDRTRVLAYGEYLKNPEWRQDGKNLLFLEYGDSLGCTLVTPSGIFRGAGFAGELGHVVFDPSGKYCRCGARGCIEVLSDNSAVLEKTTARLKTDTLSMLNGKHTLAVSDVANAYLNKDRLAQNIINEVWHEFGMAFSVAVAVFHPDNVVVVSENATVSKCICEFLKSEIEQKLLPAFGESVKFSGGANSDSVVLSGVGLMIFDEMIMNCGQNIKNHTGTN